MKHLSLKLLIIFILIIGSTSAMGENLSAERFLQEIDKVEKYDHATM